MVKIQEAENQIITHYEVFEKRPNDADLLVPAVQETRRAIPGAFHNWWPVTRGSTLRVTRPSCKTWA